MKELGLIGFPLGHSFSKKYFTEKFVREGIEGWHYDLYPLESAADLPELLGNMPNLRGLNVTIPHKQSVLSLCDALDAGAARIGAVNTLSRENGKLMGYNTDYIGFKNSLSAWMGAAIDQTRALILGTGGAAKAVQVALEDLDIPYQYVSRSAREGVLAYSEITRDVLGTHSLLINTTPLGMAPKVSSAPDLPYKFLTEKHWLYDLVYNPEVTRFMKSGLDQKSRAKNGLEMLIGQAEASWKIWQAQNME